MATHAERQKRRARKAARQRKRQQKKAAASGDRNSPTARERAVVRRVEAAASWPLHEVLISESWLDPCKLTQVLVARRAPDGRVAAALFLVDHGCLGAKDGLASVFSNASAYRGLRRRVCSNMPMETGDPALAAKIVSECIRYARALGFEPHPDAVSGLPLLGEPGACPVEVPLGGGDGKPFYVQGPHDDARRVLDRLDERLGPDGYHFLVGGPVPGLGPESAEDEFAVTGAHEEGDLEDDGRLLFAFAEPVLEGGSKSQGFEEVETVIHLAAGVWNAVVEDQVRGTQATFRRYQEALVRKAGVDQGPLRVFLETLRDRKLRDFPEKIVRFEGIRVTETGSGDVQIALRVGRLLSDEAG